MTQFFKPDIKKLYLRATKIMTPEEFMEASFSELANITKIDRHRWCRYLNGRVPPTYKTIKNASVKLNMSMSTLVDCIEKRIETGKLKKTCV